MYLCVCVIDWKRCGVESSSVDDDNVVNVSLFFWKCLNMVILDKCFLSSRSQIKSIQCQTRPKAIFATVCEVSIPILDQEEYSYQIMPTTLEIHWAEHGLRLRQALLMFLTMPAEPFKVMFLSLPKRMSTNHGFKCHGGR